MKTEIVTADNNQEIVLIERTCSNDFDSDCITVKTIGRGFVPYLMHLGSRNKTIKELFSMKNIEASPTREELFSEYFGRAYSNYDIPKIAIPRTPDKELREQFKTVHIEAERKEFAALPAEYQEPFEALFNDYLSWVTGKKAQAPKEYDSIYRARAFCIYLMYLDGRITKEDIESRGRITDIIDREFPPEVKTAGKQTYDELNSKEYIYLNYSELKEKYRSDFEYGQKLFLMKYPNS